MKRALLLAVLVAALGGCAVRHMALDRMGDAVAQGGGAFASDDEPELVRAAAPFGLKLIESLLAERPRHRGLLLAASRGFTQYAYAFVQQDAEQAETRDLGRARRLEESARQLYQRARDYGRRGLAEAPDDVALLYWTAAAWAGLIALSKDEPEVLAGLPQVEALLMRALERDEAYDGGAIHSLLIGFEMVRQGQPGQPAERARRRFARAMKLSGGMQAAPLVALAEAVSVPEQRRGEFEALLAQVLRIDVDRHPESRLANLVAQRRARWLLSRGDHLFSE